MNKLRVVSILYSYNAGSVPTVGQLERGELALNIADKKMYFRLGNVADPTFDTLGVADFNPGTLAGLADVELSGLADGDMIHYNLADSKWHNFSVLDVAHGGTGKTTTEGAFEAIAPSGSKGDVMYHNGTKWVTLPKGLPGTVLVPQTDGSLEWQAINAGSF